MQNSVERMRLRKLVGDEPVCAWFVLTKCAAALLVVTLLSVLARHDAPVMTGAHAQSREMVAGARNKMNAEAHRRQVFAQRHEQFRNGAPQRNIVSESADPFKASPGLRQ